jgi:hypothetical protein
LAEALGSGEGLHAQSARGGLLVNWKTDLKLSDLDGAVPVEIACRRCGQTRTETAAALMRRPEFEQAYLDEVRALNGTAPNVAAKQMRVLRC